MYSARVDNNSHLYQSYQEMTGEQILKISQKQKQKQKVGQLHSSYDAKDLTSKQIKGMRKQQRNRERQEQGKRSNTLDRMRHSNDTINIKSHQRNDVQNTATDNLYTNPNRTAHQSSAGSTAFRAQPFAAPIFQLGSTNPDGLQMSSRSRKLDFESQY